MLLTVGVESLDASKNACVVSWNTDRSLLHEVVLTVWRIGYCRHQADSHGHDVEGVEIRV